MDTRGHESGPVQTECAAPATIRWTFGVPADSLKWHVLIRVDSCPFVVEPNGSG